MLVHQLDRVDRTREPAVRFDNWLVTLLSRA